MGLERALGLVWAQLQVDKNITFSTLAQLGKNNTQINLIGSGKLYSSPEKLFNRYKINFEIFRYVTLNQISRDSDSYESLGE